MRIMSFEISDWHALFIHFPIALLSTGFLLDLLGTYYKKEIGEWKWDRTV